MALGGSWHENLTCGGSCVCMILVIDISNLQKNITDVNV